MPERHSTLVALIAAAGMVALALTSPTRGAVQGEVDAKYLIPVPKEQRKISPGASKAFQDGELTIALDTADRNEATLSANGGEPIKLPASTNTLVDIGKDRICTVVFLGLVGKRAIISATCNDATLDLRAALDAQNDAAPKEVIDPTDLLATAAKGSLKNPYLGNPEAIEEGHHLFLNNSCNGCHGGNGGGGMGPAFSNGVWVYGKEDDTLFRLVTLGSDGLQAEGYSRIAREKVVGPMPPYMGIITSSDDLWKILAFVRSTSKSDAPKAVAAGTN